MVALADRVSNTGTSPILQLAAKAREIAKTPGPKMISLGVGEPDFDVPDHVKKAAIEAITNQPNQGSNRYTSVPGIDPLREAISEKFTKSYGINCSKDHVIVGVGAKQAIFNVLMATLNKGDEVIIVSPYWASYPDMVKVFEGVPVLVKANPETLKINPDDLRKSISSKTKWVILNSPSNPSGIVYSKEDLEGIADVLRDNEHMGIISDDIYELMIYDDQKFYNMLQVAPDLSDRIVTINGLSKSHAMMGWRIGYSVTTNMALNKAMTAMQSQVTTCTSSVSQKAALAALNSSNDFMIERNDAYVKRRDTVLAAIDSIEGLSCIKPHGAFYAFPSCSGLFGKKTKQGNTINTDSDFCEYLLTEYRVNTVPGSAFGQEGFFRISYVTSDEDLNEAMNRIKDACKSLV